MKREKYFVFKLKDDKSKTFELIFSGTKKDSEQFLAGLLISEYVGYEKEIMIISGKELSVKISNSPIKFDEIK